MPLSIQLCALLFPVLTASVPQSPPEGQRIPVLVVTGANNHDWEWTSAALERMLDASGRFEVDVARDPARELADRDRLARYRALVLDYNGPRWGEPAESAFLEAVRGGTGVVVIHAANNAFEGWTEYERLVGDLWREGTGHGRFHEFDVVVTDRDHPITRDLPDLRAHPDELYHRLVRAPGAQHRVLATAHSSKESGGTGEEEPMVMVGAYGEGRVFHTPLGHVWKGVERTRASQEDPQFQELVVRGTEWAATGEVAPRRVREARMSVSPGASGPAEWTSLFDGETTAGWRRYRGDAFPEKGWRVAGGALVVEAGGGGGDIVTEQAFGDFELELEWKVTPRANSGIVYRATEEADAPWMTGPECQVLDDAALGENPNGLHSAAALYDLAAPRGKELRPVGEWNRARIVVRGWGIEHWLNGVRVVECDLASPEGMERIARSKFARMPGFAKAARGHVSLQDHGDEVHYRAIRARELPAEEVRLFNGVDLSGWTAHLPEGAKMEDVWSVTGEGVLVCKGNPVGYLRTEDDYTNFILRLEWRFSPVTKQAGNSGVLVRMIGEDKVWPRCIEAQLQSGSAGDFWNIGEFPMKTDPERTKGRNTKHTHANENPVGEWNEYEIRVDGPRVVLAVNGQVVNEATGCLVTPGKICLQSEGAEIHFRNVRLISLD